jgi:hypothetical protein
MQHACVIECRRAIRVIELHTDSNAYVNLAMYVCVKLHRYPSNVDEQTHEILSSTRRTSLWK